MALWLHVLFSDPPIRPKILLGAPSSQMGEINTHNSLMTYPINPKKIIFWISLRILHKISVTAKKLITCFKVDLLFWLIYTYVAALMANLHTHTHHHLSLAILLSPNRSCCCTSPTRRHPSTPPSPAPSTASPSGRTLQPLKPALFQ